MTRHSLWLMPPRQSDDVFQAAIQTLAARLGTPVFEPHVTLAQDISGVSATLAKTTRSLVVQLQPIAVRLMRTETSAEYYRAVILVAEGSEALHGAHRTAARVFGISASHEYKPHLSLAYGNLSLGDRESASKIAIALVPAEFVCSELRLYQTEGPVSTWRLIERFELSPTCRD